MFGRTSWWRRHLARCPSPIWKAGGDSATQASCASGQRGANRQTSDRSTCASNTEPGMLLSCSSTPSSPGGCGTQDSRPTVYGWRGFLKRSRTGACSTTSPAYMTATRSATRDMTPRLWLTNKIPAFTRSFSSTMRSSIVASVVTSKPVVGSSMMSRCGSQASAMAMTTRCCIPPLSWWGYRRPMRPGSASPTLSNSSTARARASSAVMPRCSISASSTCRPTRMDGFREVTGSW